MTKEEAVKILEFEKEGVFKSLATKNALDMGIEALKNTEELMQVCDKQADLIEKLGAYAKAYTDICEGLQARYEELEHETELLEADLQDGERGVGITRKCFEVRVKKELLRDVICFMTQALEEAKEGSGE